MRRLWCGIHFHRVVEVQGAREVGVMDVALEEDVQGFQGDGTALVAHLLQDVVRGDDVSRFKVLDVEEDRSGACWGGGVAGCGHGG